MTLSNRKDKTCLTIDCRDNIPNGPGKFKTNAKNEEQLCYFNEKANEKTFNTFLSKRIPHEHEIFFK